MKKTNYFILGVAAVILVGVVGLFLAGGPRSVMQSLMAGTAPDDLDTAETRLTDQGRFQITFTSSMVPVPVNQMHTWTIHIENSAGQPIEGAEVTVDGGMPQHGHGLPTRPQVTQDLGNGDYLVEGMKFNMPGWWEVTLGVTASGQSDMVTFNLVLK